MAESTFLDNFIRNVSPVSVLINSGLYFLVGPLLWGKTVPNGFRLMSYYLSNQKKRYLFPNYTFNGLEQTY